MISDHFKITIHDTDSHPYHVTWDENISICTQTGIMEALRIAFDGATIHGLPSVIIHRGWSNIRISSFSYLYQCSSDIMACLLDRQHPSGSPEYAIDAISFTSTWEAERFIEKYEKLIVWRTLTT